MESLLSITLFTLLGAAFVFMNLRMGGLLRPKQPSPEKSAVYECGEPAIGPSWVQFDLRFYIVALVFLVFDVEVALFYPWAVVYGDAAAVGKTFGASLLQVRHAALVDLLFFFSVLMVGFAYLWRFDYLDFVRSAATPAVGPVEDAPPATATPLPPTPAATAA